MIQMSNQSKKHTNHTKRTHFHKIYTQNYTNTFISDETVYRLSVYRLIGSVYRYRTDLEPIPNLKSVYTELIPISVPIWIRYWNRYNTDFIPISKTDFKSVLKSVLYRFQYRIQIGIEIGMISTSNTESKSFLSSFFMTLPCYHTTMGIQFMWWCY